MKVSWQILHFFVMTQIVQDFLMKSLNSFLVMFFVVTEYIAPFGHSNSADFQLDAPQITAKHELLSRFSKKRSSPHFSLN